MAVRGGVVGSKGNNAVLKRRTEQGGMNLVDGFTLIIGGDTV